ncbi:response regulator transcription factor [uncultured Allofournierella sp.]|uniref:response regulator transcription factor n=1 Tax=uncultured Allofournierella sp. TaxID=1940258 RepID=UPI0025E9B62B|nr:response regulator transcription factor [uncultured Fournierella sp.]
MKQIFFVEDDRSLISGLTFALERQGYAVQVARTFAEAQSGWRERPYDLIILDVALPDGSGYDLCRIIRQTSQVPILFLTAADEETDVIMGLDIGGDDYITKPFKLAIFLSRVNALLRRSGSACDRGIEISSHGIILRLLERNAYKNGTPVNLTAGEFKLLCLFMQNPDTVLSPGQILGRLWDHEGDYIDNSTLTVYIRRLRAKIEEEPANPRRIVTIRGMGYKWSSAE